LDFLEVAEYFVLEVDHFFPKRYRYQWMNSTKEQLRKRWDNVGHFPNLPNFPHHIHIGEEGNVIPGIAINIIELIKLIESEIK